MSSFVPPLGVNRRTVGPDSCPFNGTVGNSAVYTSVLGYGESGDEEGGKCEWTQDP